MVDRYVEGFLLHRESEGRSSKTLAWHDASLRLFTAWLRDEEHPFDPVEWTPTLIRKYFVHLRERKAKSGNLLSPTSVRTYASSVLAFCRWLHDEELIPKNIVERVSAPKPPQLIKEPFAASDIKRMLLVAARDKRNGKRDHALLLFMLDTGCRANEVVTLKTDDILWSQRLCKVRGKGNKERVVFLSAETMKQMQRYHLRSSTHELFFLSEEGRPMTPSGLLQIMKRLGKRAGVSDCHPHRFRHTFSISFLRSGGNVLALQRILGHTTLTMTQRYVALVSDDLAKEHVAHSPVQFMLK